MTLKEENFIAVVDQYQKLIAKIVRSYCFDQTEHSDLTQEILLQLWKSFDKYDDQYALSTWIYRIALNVAISYHRKIKLRKSQVSLDHVLNNAVAPEEEEAETDYLYRLLALLSEIERAIMILYLEEKTHAEIAEIIGISKSNVGTRIGRIKSKLSKHHDNHN